MGIVNALGEGRVWVTNKNGVIGVGDLITTSVIPGYGQKQDDDLLHSYTVAKITGNIDWNSVDEKVIHAGNEYKAYLASCIYYSG